MRLQECWKDGVGQPADVKQDHPTSRLRGRLQQRALERWFVAVDRPQIRIVNGRLTSQSGRVCAVSRAPWYDSKPRLLTARWVAYK